MVEIMHINPILYVRKTSEERHASFFDTMEAPGYKYLNYVHIENNEQGYFQFALLSLLGGKFYLYWHANYFDTIVICSKDALDNVIERYHLNKRIPETVIEKLKNTKYFLPLVNIDDKWATVKLLKFSKWGGFFLKYVSIQRTFPHKIDVKKSENIVHYNCGVMF